MERACMQQVKEERRDVLSVLWRETQRGHCALLPQALTLQTAVVMVTHLHTYYICTHTYMHAWTSDCAKTHKHYTHCLHTKQRGRESVTERQTETKEDTHDAVMDRVRGEDKLTGPIHSFVHHAIPPSARFNLRQSKHTHTHTHWINTHLKCPQLVFIQRSDEEPWDVTAETFRDGSRLKEGGVERGSSSSWLMQRINMGEYPFSYRPGWRLQSSTLPHSSNTNRTAKTSKNKPNKLNKQQKFWAPARSSKQSKKNRHFFERKQQKGVWKKQNVLPVGDKATQGERKWT